MAESTCSGCGERFTGHGNQRFCGPKCRERAKYRRDLASGREQRKNERRRQRYAARRAAGVTPPEVLANRRFQAKHFVAHEPRDCDLCGSSFLPRTSIQRFCSKPCRRLVANLRKRADRDGAVFNPLWRVPATITPAVPGIEWVYAQLSGSGGMFVYCPRCVDHLGGPLLTSHRNCLACGVSIAVAITPEEMAARNVEEVSS